MFNLIQNAKELYSIDKVNVAEAWFMVPVSKRILEFKMFLVKKPSIPLGALDLYIQKGREV